MDSNYEDSDDSSIFVKPIGQKRKATDNLINKNFKQAKLNLIKRQQNKETVKRNPDNLKGNVKTDDNPLESTKKEDSKPSKSSEYDSETDDLISSYFAQTRTTNVCPLCLASFENDDSGYVIHMKRCARVRNVTTRQLLVALELQKRQLYQRKGLRLPLQMIPCKKSKKKGKKEMLPDYDLALGLALSETVELKERQAALKLFGFNYEDYKVEDNTQIEKVKRLILKTRTPEERQRIVMEKAAVVLLDEDKEKNSENVAAKPNSDCQSDSLAKLQNKEPRLWNLGGDEGNSKWYVNKMKDLIAEEVAEEVDGEIEEEEEDENENENEDEEEDENEDEEGEEEDEEEEEEEEEEEDEDEEEEEEEEDKEEIQEKEKKKEDSEEDKEEAKEKKEDMEKKMRKKEEEEEEEEEEDSEEDEEEVKEKEKKKEDIEKKMEEERVEEEEEEDSEEEEELEEDGEEVKEKEKEDMEEEEDEDEEVDSEEEVIEKEKNEEEEDEDEEVDSEEEEVKEKEKREEDEEDEDEEIDSEEEEVKENAKKKEDRETEEKGEGKEEEENTHRRLTQNDLAREIEILDLPKEQIHHDWKNMINSNQLSDIFGRTKDSETVYLHSLVLFVRCPNLLGKDHKSIFSNHSLSTILVFLEYLYCGTLNGLTSNELSNLSKLACELDYKELANVLNDLKNNLMEGEGSEGIIPSSLTPEEESRSEDNEIAIVDVRDAEKEDEEVGLGPEEKDIFAEDLVDLTQSNHSSPAPQEDEDKDEGNDEVNDEGNNEGNDEDKVEDKNEDEEEEDNPNANKSYWSFLEDRRREKLKEELRKKEEEREKAMMMAEREKINRTLEQQKKVITRICSEFEEQEVSSFKKISKDDEEKRERRSKSNDSAKDLFENVKNKEAEGVAEEEEEEDCIVLSSDSENEGLNGEEEAGNCPVDDRSKPPEVSLDFEAPCFDPYENANEFSNCNFSPMTAHSQSLVSEIAPFSSPLKKASNKINAVGGTENRSKGPEYHSTPVIKRQPLSRISSSPESKSREKRRKGGSLIIRKSLGLKGRRSKSASGKKKSTKRRESGGKRKNLAKALAESVLSELSTSLMAKTSTPVQNGFVEMTPRTTRDLEFGESMTPSPNFTNMGESMLKEHLSKYGLKKSLAKTKARKILRLIYEELHPILNTETGKFVKVVPTEKPKGRKGQPKKKTENKSNPTKSKKKKDSERATTKEQENSINDSLTKHPDLMSDGSGNSLERSMENDSDRSEFEDVQEPMTQSVANNPVDLPSALNEYLHRNPEFHQKILLYEPIWLEELQRQMKEVFQKHFKLSDLMDYLDQKCITFRSEAQKKGNEKKNQRSKKYSKSKKTCSS